jgi:hypothetical protein
MGHLWISRGLARGDMNRTRDNARERADAGDWAAALNDGQRLTLPVDFSERESEC